MSMCCSEPTRRKPGAQSYGATATRVATLAGPPAHRPRGRCWRPFSLLGDAAARPGAAGRSEAGLNPPFAPSGAAVPPRLIMPIWMEDAWESRTVSAS
jgi:hypothetical protein